MLRRRRRRRGRCDKTDADAAQGARPCQRSLCYWLVGLACVVAMLLTLSILATILLLQRSDANARLRNAEQSNALASQWASRARMLFDSSYYIAQGMRGYIRACFVTLPNVNGTVDERTRGQHFADFERVARMYDSMSPTLAAILLAPGGAVSQMWPTSLPLHNYDLFDNRSSAHGIEPPYATMLEGNIYIEGPLYKSYDDHITPRWLVNIRVPVYNITTPEQHRVDNFWGLVYVVVDVKRLIDDDAFVADAATSYLWYSRDPDGTINAIASTLSPNATQDELRTFIARSAVRLLVDAVPAWYVAVQRHAQRSLLTRTNVMVTAIVVCGGLLLLFVVAALVIERCTRTYDGRLYAPKLTPFALLTVGPCYGEELWNLVPVQMAEVMDRLNRVLNRQMAAHRAYKVAQMQPYTTVFVLRTVEAAVHMSFDVITELQRHPIDADLATLLDEDGQLLMAYAVHLCTDVAIVPSVIGDRGYRYEGADMVYGARMWAFAAPNTVTLSAAAQPHACAMRRQRRGRGRRCAGLQVALLARVCLPHDTAAQPLYTITDTQRATLRRALAVAKAHTSKSQYVAKIVRAYCHDDGGSSSAGGGGGAVGGDDVQRAALRSGHDEMDDDGYDDDEEDDDDDDDDGYDEETSSNSSNNCSIDDGGDNADEDSAYGDGGCRAARRARLRRRTCRQSTAARDGDAAELNPLESNSLITLVDTSDYSPAAHRRSGGGGGGGAHTGSDDTATHASRTSVCVATTAAAAMSSLSSSSTSTAMTDLLLLRQQQQVQRQRRQRRAQQRQQLQQQLRQHAQHDGPCDSDVERVCSRNSSGSVVADGEPVTRARERGSALVADDNNNNDDDTMPTHVTDATATAAAASEGHDGGETALPPRRHATPARRRSQRAAHGDNARHARHYDYGNGSVSSNNSSGSNSNSSSVFAYMTARRRRTGSAGSSSYNSSVCRHSVSTTHSAAHSHTSIAHANDDNNNDNDDDAPATSSPLCAHVAARSSTAVATPAKLLVTPPDTTTAAATAVVVKPTSGTPTRAAHHVAVPLSSPEATAMHHDDRNHHALSLSATRSPLVVAALRHMWSSSRSSSCSGGGDIHGHRGSGSTTHPTGGQQVQQQQQQCDNDNNNNKRSRLTRRRRRQQQQPQPTTQARKSRATAWLTVEVDTMTQQLLHPVIPLWLDKALRRAFDHQSIALAISYESVRVMVYYFYASYKLLFRPLAVPERDNIYRRLITAFGIPRKDILEHLAARCTIHYMQQHEHTKSLAWKTYA